MHKPLAACQCGSLDLHMVFVHDLLPVWPLELQRVVGPWLDIAAAHAQGIDVPPPPINLEWGDHTLDRKQYIMLYCGGVWRPCSSRIVSVLK